jgi:hypothetical protein
MPSPRRPISRYTTLHIALVPRADGSYAVSAVEKTWANGAKDSARVVHRGTARVEARPGNCDEALWMAGQYFQQLAARGVVTRLGLEPTKEAPREPRGAVGGAPSTPEELADTPE